MRIIAGQFKGQTLSWPKTPLVRPMTDLVRESLFNILGPLGDLTVLDAYAGSGAIGLEALSRGAMAVAAIEILPAAQGAIRRNLLKLKIESNYRLHAMSVEQWLARTPSKFDLIVAGPPFAGLEVAIINQLATLLNHNGIFVLWHTSRIDPPLLQSLQLTDSRKYGDSQLSFYALLTRDE